MKTNNLFRITLVAASVLVMFACQKSSSSSGASDPTSTANVQTAADDQTMVTNQDEATDNDAELALSSSASISGSAVTPTTKSSNSPLGLTINIGLAFCGDSVSYDTTTATRTLTIIYDGLDCLGKNTRSGTISITVPQGQHWRDIGATVTLNVNLSVTRKSDGKTIIIKGTKTIVNTDGGLLTDLATVDSVVRDISASWSITFPNGTTRTWTVAKHRVFTYSDGVVMTTINGLGSAYAISGTNRFGVAFTSSITEPKVFEQSCDFNLVSGQDTFTRGDKISGTITYGLSSTGSAVTGCPTGGFYAELIWTNSSTGKTYTYIYPY